MMLWLPFLTYVRTKNTGGSGSVYREYVHTYVELKQGLTGGVRAYSI